MQISFGHDAGEAFWRLAQSIPEGYLVALLPNGRDVPVEIDPNVDVMFVKADIDGVHYNEVDSNGDRVSDTVYIRGWEDISRIHVY